MLQEDQSDWFWCMIAPHMHLSQATKHIQGSCDERGADVHYNCRVQIVLHPPPPEAAVCYNCTRNTILGGGFTRKAIRSKSSETFMAPTNGR